MTVQMKDPNVDLHDESIDPVVRAAMIQQPTDEKEEKSTQSGSESTAAPTDKDKGEGVEPNLDEGKKDDLEANPDKNGEGEEESLDKPTRKERREQRKAFLDQVRREQEQKGNKTEKLFQGDPNYKPLDFENKDYDAKELVDDRNAFGQNQFYKGAQTAQQLVEKQAEQDKFWQATEYESKLLEKEPEFAFLDETNTESFDPDKTAFVNESYLAFVGYDPNTNTVQRPEISFEKYTRLLVNQVKTWAEDYSEDAERNAAAQKGNSGIRPSGSPRKSLGQLKPGDISSMSDADYEANRDEINRQILAAL